MLRFFFESIICLAQNCLWKRFSLSEPNRNVNCMENYFRNKAKPFAAKNRNKQLSTENRLRLKHQSFIDKTFSVTYVALKINNIDDLNSYGKAFSALY